MKEEWYRGRRIDAKATPSQDGSFAAWGMIYRHAGWLWTHPALAESFHAPGVFLTQDKAIQASLACGRELIDAKLDLVPCRSKARWWFYSDKFLGGFQGICTTCLFAFLESHVSYAVPIRKPWLFRRRCSWSHERDYAGSVMDKLQPRNQIIEGAPGVIVGDRAGPGKALYVVITGSVTEAGRMTEFEIHTKLGLTKEEAEQVRSKAHWLADNLGKPLAEMCPSVALDSIRVRRDEYVVCLTCETGIDRLSFDRNLVNDMTDPAKPHPETRAKFNAKVRGQLEEVQRHLRISRRLKDAH